MPWSLLISTELPRRIIAGQQQPITPSDHKIRQIKPRLFLLLLLLLLRHWWFQGGCVCGGGLDVLGGEGGRAGELVFKFREVEECTTAFDGKSRRVVSSCRHLGRRVCAKPYPWFLPWLPYFGHPFSPCSSTNPSVLPRRVARFALALYVARRRRAPRPLSAVLAGGRGGRRGGGGGGGLRMVGVCVHCRK